MGLIGGELKGRAWVRLHGGREIGEIVEERWIRIASRGKA